MKSTSSVVVVYEEEVTREVAVNFCDHLVERFWSRAGFDVSWWSFALLEDPGAAWQAAQKAIHADIIIFATRPEGEMPQRIREWIESWLGQREDREGAFVALIDESGAGVGAGAGKQIYLRQVAHRAGMDYLTQVPQEISRAIPDSLEWCTERAGQVTNVLEEILHQHPPPSRLYS